MELKRKENCRVGHCSTDHKPETERRGGAQRSFSRDGPGRSLQGGDMGAKT